MLDTATDRQARCLSKIFRCWEDREDGGFEIDRPGTRVTEIGPNGRRILVREYRYCERFASANVAVEYAGDGNQYARVLALGFHDTPYAAPEVFDTGEARVRAWLRKHGTLQ